MSRQIGVVVARRYELQRKLGEGAMSEVWEACDLRKQRQVAIKLVAFQSSNVDDSRARFEREARVCQKLQGPGFVRVYDFGFLGAHGFLVMDLLQGETLEQKMKREGVISIEDATRLLREVGAALSQAHQAGIVHRDLKPANVFLRDSPAQALILDFGVAAVSDENQRLTRPGTLLGSAAYMSPEQIRNGRSVDERSDLWSLAVILFRALSGERPFSGDSAEVLVSILNDPPRSYVGPSGGPNLGAFFARALHKEPRGRFQTMAEFMSAFDAALSGEDGCSGRPTFIEPLPPAKPAATPAIADLTVPITHRDPELAQPPIPDVCEQTANVPLMTETVPRALVAPSKGRTRALPIALSVALLALLGTVWLLTRS
jgi:serine/threonine protein kinase